MVKKLMLSVMCCVALAAGAQASVAPHAVEKSGLVPNVSVYRAGDGSPVSPAAEFSLYAQPPDVGPSLAASFRSSSGRPSALPSTTTLTTQIDFDYDRSTTTATPASPVPEPASMVLLGLGLMGGGLAARKRRARR